MKSVVRHAFAGVVPAILLSACQVEIQHELSEKEANEILVLLERKGISVKKEHEEGGKEPTWKISVPKAHAATAAMLLKENELPRPRTPGMEIFNKGSLIPTATEERAMYLQALQGDLSRTLSSVAGVLDARVHINIPQLDDLSDRSEKPKPTASVLVRFRSATEPGKKTASGPPLSDKQIQEIVSRAVQDLTPESVSVVMTAAVMPGGTDDLAPRSVDVMGIRMDQGSVGNFRILLVVLIGIILAESGWLLFKSLRTDRPSGPPPRARPRPEV